MLVALSNEVIKTPKSRESDSNKLLSFDKARNELAILPVSNSKPTRREKDLLVNSNNLELKIFFMRNFSLL